MSRLLRHIRSCAAGPARTHDDGTKSMEFVFPPDFLGFSGHFPDRPILPGIVQIMTGILAAGGDAALAKVVRAKFTRIISPGEPVLVVAGCREKGGLIQADIRVSVHDETAATITLNLDPQGARG